MDDWEKLDETSLPEKEDFHNHLNLEDVTDSDYAHAKRVYIDSEIKYLSEYHDLYVQSDVLLQADVFNNFHNMYLEIYGRDPANFFLHQDFQWQAALKKTKAKLKQTIN